MFLLMIGINDNGGAQAAQNLKGIMEKIVSARPQAHLVVAQITPMAKFSQPIVDYNTAIRDTLVPDFQRRGLKVDTVDQYRNFLKPDGTIDPALFSIQINHPNATGYDRMAKTWFDTIQAILIAAKNETSDGKKPNEKTMKKPLLTLFLGLLFGLSAQANETKVEANRVAEVSLISAKPYANPFMEVEVDAMVTRPDGKKMRIPAFWAGGDDWKFRYASELPGTHSWKTESKDATNAGLHGLSGKIEVVPGTSDNPLFKHGRCVFPPTSAPSSMRMARRFSGWPTLGGRTSASG
jgi:hypothetical protein